MVALYVGILYPFTQSHKFIIHAVIKIISENNYSKMALEMNLIPKVSKFSQ